MDYKAEIKHRISEAVHSEDGDKERIIEWYANQIVDLIKERDKQVVGDNEELPYNVEHPHHERHVEDVLTQNSMKDEIRQRMEESL